MNEITWESTMCW